MIRYCFVLLLLISSHASAQNWNSQTNGTIGTGRVVQFLSPNAGSDRVAYYALVAGSTTDSKTITVTDCNEVSVMAMQSAGSTYGAADLMEALSPTLTSNSVQICTDHDGGGIDDTDCDKNLLSDDGTNKDGDATAEQRAIIWSIRNADYIWIDPTVAPVGASMIFKASCR